MSLGASSRWRIQFSLRVLLALMFVATVVIAFVVWWRTPRLASDVEARLRQDFPAEQWVKVRSILLAYDPAWPRIHRCILHVADGHLDRFHDMVRLAEQDYRDAIVAAEYQGPEMVRVYDFGRPFGEADKPPFDE